MTTSALPADWTREEAIGRLRARLLELTDEEHSICQIAAAKGIFCRGFRRWNGAEFHKKWKPAIGSSTHLTRDQMEQFANLWQLTEQVRLRVGFACDAGTLSCGPCRGWDELGNDVLARTCADVLGVHVRIAAHRPDASAS